MSYLSETVFKSHQGRRLRAPQLNADAQYILMIWRNSFSSLALNVIVVEKISLHTGTLLELRAADDDEDYLLEDHRCLTLDSSGAVRESDQCVGYLLGKDVSVARIT